MSYAQMIEEMEYDRSDYTYYRECGMDVDTTTPEMAQREQEENEKADREFHARDKDAHHSQWATAEQDCYYCHPEAYLPAITLDVDDVSQMPF